MPRIITVNPQEEWKSGYIGWLTRISGIVITTLAESALSVAGFLFAHWVVGVLILGAGAFLVCALLLMRHYRLQRIHSSLRLHTFCHEARDEVQQILLARNPTEYQHRLNHFHLQSVGRIANYFRELIGDHTINSAIRLAQITPAGEEVYATRARSDGMDTSRQTNSVPIPKNRGMPSTFLQMNYQGVYLVPDIKKAIDEGSWMETPNDRLPDVKQVMVAPINGWDRDQKVMLGMLYVTSVNHTFRPSDAIPLKAFGDFLGLVYPILSANAQSPEPGVSQNAD